MFLLAYRELKFTHRGDNLHLENFSKENIDMLHEHTRRCLLIENVILLEIELKRVKQWLTAYTVITRQFMDFCCCVSLAHGYSVFTKPWKSEILISCTSNQPLLLISISINIYRRLDKHGMSNYVEKLLFLMKT